jgi:hypothetical protein
MTSSSEITKSHCNSCGRETEHDICHTETISEFEGPDHARERRQVVIRCRGCKDLTIRIEDWFFDYTPDPDVDHRHLTIAAYIPPRQWRRRPEWLKQLEQVDADLSDILQEVYLAANDKQSRLLAMGVRTAFDYLMTQMVGDVGDFPKKLSEMVAKGHLTQKQSDMLATIIDAASATAHRGFKPEQQLLEEMVNMMETTIRDHYLTGPSLKRMQTIIPPRPPRLKQ